MKPQRRPLLMTTKAIYDFGRNHGRVLAGQVSFGATMLNKEFDRNIQCSKASGATPVGANTEFAVSHNLNRVPITLGGWDTNNGGVLYRSTTPWTKTQVFLKCTTASAAYNLVLI